jgi:uncharacterized membrane protein YkvA (DUF1232 family)
VTKAIERLRRWAHNLKRDTILLYVAARDPRVPWYAKAVAGLVAAYALSPIDLIPDFVPILGYLDDLIIVPLGIRLTLRLVPKELIPELRTRAEAIACRPISRVAAGVIVTVWLMVATLVGLSIATLL